MDSRKDIYNLWVQYTTKNEETYFRQFIAGFVSIWHSQLQLDFENAPRWDAVAPDLGPHLSRLPDELLPAIEKFLIIARDGCENGREEEEGVHDSSMRENVLLVQCLTVICRHFENISAVINSTYISSCIAIANFIITRPNDEQSTDQEADQLFVTSVARLLEVLYDPYLTWRSYLRGHHADYSNLSYKISQLQPEIVPFIYDCFQGGKVTKHVRIGKDLVHILGAVIAGSQHNGLRAISPATVTIIIDVICKWESNAELRQLMLHCFALMAVILQKSSPEQRQIDLLTIFQLYIGSIRDLLTTEHFLTKSSSVGSFELSHDDDNYIDVGALCAALAIIRDFIPDHANKLILCNALFEAKFLANLVQIPEQVKKWNIDHQTLGTVLVETLQKLCYNSEKMQHNLMHTNYINVLFDGLKDFGKPSSSLISQCLGFAFDDHDTTLVNPVVVTKLIEWIPLMGENEQNMLSEVMLKKCAGTMQSKQHVCSQKTIKRIVDVCLSCCQRLSSKCAINLLKLIEELAKYSIFPAEVNSLFRLLRSDAQFEYRKLLLETILRITQHRSSVGMIPDNFLDIQTNTSGITIPEIRKWETTHGFVFHAWLRLEEEHSIAQNYRRQLFSLTTNYGTGYEFFVQKNGNFVVSVITKKEFFTATVQSPQLLDGRWHSVTVSVVPPKRLFSYHQINVYIDSVQKLGSTMKYASFAEVFHYCSIGAPYNNFRKVSHTSHQSNSARMSPVPDPSASPSSEKEEKSKSSGLFPNLIERTFFPGLVSQVPNYFTLPSKSTSSLDPSVKSYPIGMQDLVFGEAICLKGQLGAVLLADTNINLKNLFEAGPNVANVLATDMIESFDMASKFVFCFAPNACFDGLCLDLAPGNQYNGHLVASVANTLSLQNALNGIGGMVALLPIVDSISLMPDSDLPSANELISLSPVESPLKEEHFGDWEMLQLNSLTEAKIIQNPIACFLCLVRNFIGGSELNKENMLKNDAIAIISTLLQKCNERLFDVNVLMAVQLLIESIQNEMPSGNMELLHVLHRDLVFNFRIWAKAQFQIVIGHVQYISTIIKDDRKYFRRHFGIQYMLDVVQEHFTNNTNLPPQDAKMVRESLLRIVKYYIQKEVNIKEISSILTFLTTTKHEATVGEIIDMLVLLIEGKHVKDQIFLLMYEPHMAEAMYMLFIDRHFGSEVHTKLIKFITGMLCTKRISAKHKAALRLYDTTIECHSLYPGLFSFMLPFQLEPHVILGLLDLNLSSDTEMGYAGALCLMYHSNLLELSLKLEIARRLMTSTFTKPKAPQMIAKQVGWQESIARLLIKKPVENRPEEGAEKSQQNLLTDMDEVVKRESESSAAGTGADDLIVFDEENLELHVQDSSKQPNSFMSEAATALEHEIKELADTVQEAVVDNIASSITSVYSVIRQKTSDIQDTIGSLTLSFEESAGRKKKSSLSSSSEENVSLDESGSLAGTASMMVEDLQSTKSGEELDSSAGNSVDSNSEKYADDNEEENLVCSVSSSLFTILWRGVENSNDSWQERGQVMACINLIALNNELYCSHLALRLRILEMGVQAALMDLAENAHLALIHQQNAAQLLRLAYDLVVLDPNEDDSKKCSVKLLDGVLSLLDILMVFQQSSSDDWSEMSHLCLGLLLKCSHSANSEIVAMATAKLHALLQNRINQDPAEIGYLMYSLNQAMCNAIEVDNSEQYSFLIPVMKALLEKSRTVLGLATHTPDLPATSSGPIFFQDFQTYCASRQWTTFIDKKVRILFFFLLGVNDLLGHAGPYTGFLDLLLPRSRTVRPCYGG
uniref:DUF4704 domain-containing protein n=1 Tax=Anopheles christyi TaxID=43041 RepID=A0A182K234_9DIPT